MIHPDGYIQLKDRSKDIIISGGENISSIEVEDALYKHPAVQAAAVVAKPDEKWGETPCAFVELKPGETASSGRSHRLVPQESRQLQDARATSCSPNCPRPPPARCRSSSCARWRRRCEGASRPKPEGAHAVNAPDRVMRAKCLRKVSLARWRSGRRCSQGDACHSRHADWQVTHAFALLARGRARSTSPSR